MITYTLEGGAWLTLRVRGRLVGQGPALFVEAHLLTSLPLPGWLVLAAAAGVVLALLTCLPLPRNAAG